MRSVIKLRPLVARLLTAYIALNIALPVYGATSELKWRSERGSAAQSTTLRSKPAASVETKPSTSLRFVRPKSPSRHTDADVRVAAFEDEAPQLTSGRGDEPPIRSMVVNREEVPNGFRSAQLPSATSGASGSPLDDLRTPATDPEAPPPLETPGFELPPMPEESSPATNNQTLPPPENNMRQPDQDQRQPAVVEPTRGQFQPVLPAGPGPDQSPSTPVPPSEETAIEAEGEKAQESCSKSLENLRAYTVDKVNLNIAITGNEGTDFPFECTVDDGTQYAGRCWDQSTYMWKASALCHKPLYFEDEQLERYGHSWSPCFQPFISGAHFFCTLPVLPYCMGVEPPCECIYALGHYRPNSCAPYMINPVPISCRGAAFQAGAVTGAAAVLP